MDNSFTTKLYDVRFIPTFAGGAMIRPRSAPADW